MLSIDEVLSHLHRGHHTVYTPARALIRVFGPDAQTFLSRLSTNDLSVLANKTFTQTSFTNNKGRMIDHCLVFAQKPDEIILVSSHADVSILIAWLEQYHFVEDLAILPHAHDTCHYVIARADAPIADASFIWSHHLMHGDEVLIYATLKKPPVVEHALSDETWTTLRIMCLLPESPGEINDEVMPQNINLKDFISETKGCYIGQEVIAKAQTYQKQVKTLCGISVSENIYAMLKPRALVRSSQGQHGSITSIAPLYVAGAINALAISDLTEKTPALGDILLIGTNFLMKK